MILRALAIWLFLVVLAVLNGGVREAFITRRLGEHTAQIVSTVMLCAAIILVALFSASWIGAKDRQEAFLIGIFWALLTLAFELLAGHYVFGASWEKLMADYNVLRGRIWVLVLLTNLFAPLWAFWQEHAM